MTADERHTWMLLVGSLVGIALIVIAARILWAT